MTRPSQEPNRPAVPALDSETAARLLGQPLGLIQLWQQTGATVHRIGNTVEVWSYGTALVGRQELDDGGHPVGPYTAIVNERPDSEQPGGETDSR